MSVYYDECKCKLKKEEYDLELIKKIVDTTKYNIHFLLRKAKESP